MQGQGQALGHQSSENSSLSSSSTAWSASTPVQRTYSTASTNFSMQHAAVSQEAMTGQQTCRGAAAAKPSLLPALLRSLHAGHKRCRQQ
jgi:hypothetical protein